MKRKILITVAPVARTANPDDDVINPLTPEQIAEQTASCVKAGAAKVHLHVRTETGEITHDTAVYSQTLDLIKQDSNVIIEGSTGGFEKTLTLDERCSAIDDDRTDVASLNMGTLNITAETAFINTVPDITYWAKKFKKRSVTPILEIFDIGQIRTVNELIDDGVLEPPLNIGFPMGYYGSARACIEDLVHMRSLMPRNASFGIAHNEMNDFKMLAASIAAGANGVRVGYEDSIFYAPGDKAKTNVVLVEKVAEMIRSLGCDVMTIDEARETMGLKK